LVACPYGGYIPLDPKHALSAKMTAVVRDNRFDRNGHYGVSVDSAFALHCDKRPDSFPFTGEFSGNELRNPNKEVRCERERIVECGFRRLNLGDRSRGQRVRRWDE